MRHPSLEAVVILGCRLRWAEGRLAGSLARRVQAGASVARELASGSSSPRMIVSGGQLWDGVVEADAMRDELVRCGIDLALIDCEKQSRSTRENARFVAEMTKVRSLAVVTCEWHLPRALALFRAQGFEAMGFPAQSGPTPWSARVWHGFREKVARTLDGV